MTTESLGLRRNLASNSDPGDPCTPVRLCLEADHICLGNCPGVAQHSGTDISDFTSLVPGAKLPSTVSYLQDPPSFLACCVLHGLRPLPPPPQSTVLTSGELLDFLRLNYSLGARHQGPK